MSEEQHLEAAGHVQILEVPIALKNIVEALIFASDEPLEMKTIRMLIDDFNDNAQPDARLDANSELLRAAIEELNHEYAAMQKPYRIIALAGGFAFATGKEYAGWIGKLLKEKARRRLSATAIETLAIVAYKQPITKSEIEFIRGVNADYIMKTLLEKNLVTIIGRASTPGRPLLYGTTAEFLMHFGLNDISDLPKPREIEELIGETELEVEKRLLAEQQEIEFKEELEEKFDTKSKSPRVTGRRPKPQKPSVQETSPTVEPVPAQEASTVVPSFQHEEDEAHISVDEQEVHQDEAESSAPEEMHISTNSDSPERDEILTSAEDDKNEFPSEVKAGARAEAPVQDIGSEEEGDFKKKIEHIIIPAEAVMAEEESAATEIPGETRKGWSKWKTKIQTFFRKLFG